MFRGWQAEIQKTKKIKIKINICFNESTIYEEETAWRQFSFHTRLNTLQEETEKNKYFTTEIDEKQTETACHAITTTCDLNLILLMCGWMQTRSRQQSRKEKLCLALINLESALRLGACSAQAGRQTYK